MNSGAAHTYSVHGVVADAETRAGLNTVKVDLRAFSGGTVATAYTIGQGDFRFDNVAGGGYELVVAQAGYEFTAVRLEVDGPVDGVLIALHSTSGTRGSAALSATISTRELLIPHKAHDAMQKGLTLLYSKSDYAGSVKQFERATQEYANYYEAYSQMGVAYMEMKSTADAERALRKSIELSNEKYIDALFWIASLYTNNSRYAETEPMARKAAELDANSWQSQTELARALLGLGRAEEARDCVLTAIKLRPDNATLYLILGDTHIASQNYAGLADDLDHYLTLAPKGQFAEQARKERDQLREQMQSTEVLPDVAESPNH